LTIISFTRQENLQGTFNENAKVTEAEGLEADAPEEKEKHELIKYELERTYTPPFNVYKLYRYCEISSNFRVFTASRAKQKDPNARTIKVEVGEFKVINNSNQLKS
jgi:hypothetical protein